MSGREKPLILQNGVPIPQAYDKDLGDWTEYSTEHIKAIKAELALVKAELQAIKANQLSGDQKVTLSGTIVPVLDDRVFTVASGETVEIITRRRAQMPWLIGSIRNAPGCEVRYRVQHEWMYFSSTLQDVKVLTVQHEFCFQMVGLVYTVLVNNPTDSSVTFRVSAMETITKELGFR